RGVGLGGARPALGHSARRHHLYGEQDREREQHDLVQEAEDRDEVRDQVDRTQRIGDDRHHEELRVPGRARMPRSEEKRTYLALELPCTSLQLGYYGHTPRPRLDAMVPMLRQPR